MKRRRVGAQGMGGEIVGACDGGHVGQFGVPGQGTGHLVEVGGGEAHPQERLRGDAQQGGVEFDVEEELAVGPQLLQPARDGGGRPAGGRGKAAQARPTVALEAASMSESA